MLTSKECINCIMLYSLSIKKFRFSLSGSGLSLGLMISLRKVYKSFILISLFSFLLSRLFNIFGQNCLGDLDCNFLNLYFVHLFVFTKFFFVRFAYCHNRSLRSSAWVLSISDDRLYVTNHTGAPTMVLCCCLL